MHPDAPKPKTRIELAQTLGYTKAQLHRAERDLHEAHSIAAKREKERDQAARDLVEQQNQNRAEYQLHARAIEQAMRRISELEKGKTVIEQSLEQQVQALKNDRERKQDEVNQLREDAAKAAQATKDELQRAEEATGRLYAELKQRNETFTMLGDQHEESEKARVELEEQVKAYVESTAKLQQQLDAANAALEQATEAMEVAQKDKTESKVRERDARDTLVRDLSFLPKSIGGIVLTEHAGLSSAAEYASIALRYLGTLRDMLLEARSAVATMANMGAAGFELREKARDLLRRIDERVEPPAEAIAAPPSSSPSAVS